MEPMACAMPTLTRQHEQLLVVVVLADFPLGKFTFVVLSSWVVVIRQLVCFVIMYCDTVIGKDGRLPHHHLPPHKTCSSHR